MVAGTALARSSPRRGGPRYRTEVSLNPIVINFDDEPSHRSVSPETFNPESEVGTRYDTRGNRNDLNDLCGGAHHHHERTGDNDGSTGQYRPDRLRLPATPRAYGELTPVQDPGNGDFASRYRDRSIAKY